MSQRTKIQGVFVILVTVMTITASWLAVTNLSNMQVITVFKSGQKEITIFRPNNEDYLKITTKEEKGCTTLEIHSKPTEDGRFYDEFWLDGEVIYGAESEQGFVRVFNEILENKEKIPEKAFEAKGYTWDGVRFVFNWWSWQIKYSHPDKGYYGIDPNKDWSKRGYDLTHTMFGRGSSNQIISTSGKIGEAIGHLIGILIGLILASSIGHFLGFVVGTIAGAVIGWFLSVYCESALSSAILDEGGNIWVWMSNAFMDWLRYNANYIYLLGPFASATVLSAFWSYGYLQVAGIYLYDAIGKGPVPN